MTLKEIVTLPSEAKFVHAIAGTLYYRIITDNESIIIIHR